MDPDANLKEQLEIALEIQATLDVEGDDEPVQSALHVAERADRLAELVIALDGWIKNGGFLPAAWSKFMPGGKAIG